MSETKLGPERKKLKSREVRLNGSVRAERSTTNAIPRELLRGMIGRRLELAFNR